MSSPGKILIDPSGHQKKVSFELPILGQHLPALDGLRGVAILLVLFFHYEIRNWPWQSGWGKPVWYVISEGWLGVNLFFVLSGFLITGILHDTKSEQKYFQTFYARRTLRIFPIYYVMLIFLFRVLPLLGHVSVSASSHAWSWAYLSNIPIGFFGYAAAPEHTGHFWSLAIEEQFYLLWPLLIYRFSRGMMIRICLGCIGGALLLRIGAFGCGLPWHFGAFLTPARIDDLAMGALLALVIRSEPHWRWLARWAFPGVVGVGVVCLSLFIWRHFPYKSDPVLGTIGMTLFSLFFSMVLIHAITAPARGVVSAFWGSALLRFFGRYSYGIYMYHQLVREFLVYAGISPGALTERLHSRAWAHGIYLAINLSVTIGLALLSWHLLEKQMLKLKNKFRYQAAENRASETPQSTVSPHA